MLNTALSIHDVHPYPCKYPPHAIASYLLTNGVVLDPFCGSGTTLLEAARQGSTAIGFDCNPIAVLISRFKLLNVDVAFFQKAHQALADLSIAAQAIIMSDSSLHAFHGLDHWFGPVAQRELAGLNAWLSGVDDPQLTVWLQTALSAIINRVSYQDSETRYARTERPIRCGDVVDAFQRQARKLLTALSDRGRLTGEAHRVECLDILKGMPLANDSIDQVVTSPPYANTMDYYLYHKQRMNVLHFSFKDAQNAEIGSRWEYSSMRASKSKWTSDYGASLSEIHRVLKPGSHGIVIIGDSQIAGELIDAANLTESLASTLGFAYELLDSTPLEARSKSFMPSFQRPNKNEHTIRLTKH